MRRLLKYAFLLALAAAIGGYIVLDSLDDEPTDPVSASADATAPATATAAAPNAARPDASAATGSMDPVSPSAEEAVAAMAAVAPSNDASPDAKAANETARPVTPPAGTDVAAGTEVAALTPDEICQRDGERLEQLRSHPSSNELVRFANELRCPKLLPQVVSLMVSLPPPPAAPDVPHEASQDTRPADDAARRLAPPAGTDVAAGTEGAGLTPDEICQRDGERLKQLRSHPSSNELVRFANELRCTKLLPQVVSLMVSLPPPPAAPDVPHQASQDTKPADDAASPGAQAEKATAHPASPLARADVAAQASDETCKRDEDRLARLRSRPSGEEAQRFASELGCAALRPQLQRLMESLHFAASTPRAPADWSHSNPLLGQACASERSALDRLRQKPSARAAGLFWRDMHCEGLRPQVRLLLESLNVTPDSVGSAATPGEPEARGTTSNAPTAIGVDPAANLRRLRLIQGDGRRSTLQALAMRSWLGSTIIILAAIDVVCLALLYRDRRQRRQYAKATQRDLIARVQSRGTQ